jgi:hypothetical protein
MARPSDPQRDQVIAAICNLTAEHGVEEGVRLARLQFPDVPRGSWGRWRFEAVGRADDQQEIDWKAAATLTSEVRANIPTPDELVAPADVVPATRRALDFWRMLAELDEDAQLLREYAVKTDADGKRKVRVPFALQGAHRMRVDLMKLALQHAEVAHSIEHRQRLDAAIIEEIGDVDPQLQKRIIERLRRLSTEFDQRGF